MYQAITVKFLPATNTKGARYKARCAAGSITVSMDYALDPAPNAVRACKALQKDLGWADRGFVGGVNFNGEHVFVMI